MILVDTALRAREAEGRPIRVAIVGAGFMSQGLTNQIVNSVPGMSVVAISNRRPERARDVFHYAGLESTLVESQAAFDDVVARGGAAYTDDPFLLCRSEHVDVVCEVTGSVELGAQVCLEAFAHGKDVVLMNAELEATIGPILNVYADRARRDHVGVRRGRAGGPARSLSLGEGPRPRAARDRQRQGAAGPVSQPDDPEGVRRAVGAESGDGHVLRGRLQDLVRAGDRRECHRVHGAAARDVAWRSSTATT